MPGGPHPRTLKPLLLIPFAVLLTIHPLLIHGPSNGQDMAFHIQAWLDAAHQLRQGTLYPHWDATAAWNAGEPRFLFYPPISWTLGALLTLLFPIALCPTIFIAIALLASGLTFHKLASAFVTPNAALIAATLYLANPYMLFTAFERCAFSELLAAAWIPLLLLALLRPHPTPGSPTGVRCPLGWSPGSPTGVRCPLGWSPGSRAGSPAGVVTLRSIAIPLALLWLTNAPAAVIGSYTIALLATLRVLHAIFTSSKLSSRPESHPELVEGEGEVERPLYSAQTAAPYKAFPTIASPEAAAPAMLRYPEASASGLIAPNKKGGFSPRGMPSKLALTYLAGTVLGLTLPAIYLLPAVCERRFIQVSMAILPNLRYQDNFLFTRTSDAAHNAVNHTISTLALTLLLLTAAAILTLITKTLLLNKSFAPQNSAILSEAPHRMWVPQISLLRPGSAEPSFLIPTLALLTTLIAFLLTPLSTPIWQHLPELAFLQFPWRLLILLTPILALTIALLLDHIKGAPFMAWLHRAMGRRAALPATLLLPLAIAIPAYRLFHQPPSLTGNPTHLAQLFITHHGFPPTDEYTPTPADNDPLRSGNPAYWLLPLTANPNTPAPNTTPTAAELNPALDTDDTPVPDTQTLSAPAPHHLTLNPTQPSLLVLNLRNYPNWRITRTTPTQPSPSAQDLSPSVQDRSSSVQDCSSSVQDSRRPRRTDGLITLPLPAGPTTLNITWRRTPDEQLGLILSALSLIALALTYRTRSVS